MAEELNVGRSDPAYMAHAYLTKVPVPAILPFIETYTKPGDVVLDPFAGSGMTGVAASILGRSARLFDISVLGQHIGGNYVNLVEPEQLRKQANEVVSAARMVLGDIYAVPCAGCGGTAQLAKAVWSLLYTCNSCKKPVNYYKSMETADWNKPAMRCPHCKAPLSSRQERAGEEQVLDYIDCGCAATQREQPPTPPSAVDTSLYDFPHVEITPDREMYKASALGRNKMTTVASFYSDRNLAVLATLHHKIMDVSDEQLRSKLLFAFTASLTRASKRYQWSRQRPLNAANANYYVAAVFYEWNVFDLFLRKVEAAIRSDEWVREQRGDGTLLGGGESDVTYGRGSADDLALPDRSVDYVFTDPPFGSNLFYADMALFQEGWLGDFTDVSQEAVIDRSRAGTRSAGRYEQLLTGALSECRRVLKPGGRVSMVFGNSSGKVWALVQRAVAAAGLEIEPEALVVLNKGQRSVKGLASGFEYVATLDLIITMKAAGSAGAATHHVSATEVAALAKTLAASSRQATPSHLYLELLRHGIRAGWHLGEVDLKTVTAALVDDGWSIDSKTGWLSRDEAPRAESTEPARPAVKRGPGRPRKTAV